LPPPNTDDRETAASVTVGALGYRARCAAPRCEHAARLGLRYADAGGRPIGNLDFCHAHVQARISLARAAGLKVFDEREGS
jgi:hypothetical protein